MFSGFLIIIGDNNTPEEKSTFEYVASTLNSLQLSWFRGSQDGRIYVTKDALMYNFVLYKLTLCSDYLTQVNDKKHMTNFKQMIKMRSKLIPLLLVMVYVFTCSFNSRPIPIIYEILKGLISYVCFNNHKCAC